MRRQGGGRIVNISSIGGKIAVPHLLPYSASKFALAGYSEGLRAELRRENIFVTTVFPGLMRTGSPPNVVVKGQHEKEYAWFSIADSLPGLAMHSRRAARRILTAVADGRAQLVLGFPARAAVLFHDLMPETFALSMRATNRALPSPAKWGGDRSRTGRESESRWSRRFVTNASRRASERNNELSSSYAHG
jgi:short-subunit dehydrogenase